MRLVGWILGWALLGTAHGAVAEKLAVGELAAAADVIVVGRVLDRASRFEGTRIFTRVRVQVDTVLKGAPGAVVAVDVLGGEVDGIGQKVSGMAAFEPGEQVALFLAARGEVFETVGLAQGKLRIESDGLGVQVVRSFDGLTLVQRDATGTLVPAAPPQARQDLAGFLVELATALKTP